MNTTTDLSMTTDLMSGDYTNTVIGAINLLMIAGQWLLKLKKRLQSNEAKMEVLERKLSKMKPRTEL